MLTADITTGNELFDSNGNLKQTLPEENQWTPIVSSSDYYKQYTGTFDGQGHTISGLYVNDNNTKSVGFFGNLGNGGIIRNVGVKDSYFYNGKSSGNVGGVCGYNSNVTIENCYNERTTVSGTGNGTSIGGVCGNNNINTIKNCYNIGDVSGGNNNYDIAYIGGVCGSNNNGTIENCYYPEGTANSGIGMDMNSSNSATHLPEDDFKNGKVAWLLNGNSTLDDNAKTSPWLQNLSKNGGDQFPVLKANTANNVCPIVVGNGYNRYKNKTEHSYVNNTFADFPDYGTANLYSHVCDYCKGAAQESPKKIKQLNSANDADIVITKAGDNWTTSADITLGDDATNNWYHAPVPFTTTGTVTHTRAMSTDWITLCLPYEISTKNDNYNCKFYKLSNVVPSEKITLTEITEATIEAGTPVFVKRNDNNVNSIKFTATASNVKMIQTPTEQTADKGKLVGTFNTVTLTMDANGNCLFINNNNMWSVTQANKDMTVKPFRAYIVPDTPISAPKLSIAIDGEATAISDALDTLNDTNAEYYDINGRRISSLQKGVNIIKSGNRTRKVIIK